MPSARSAVAPEALPRAFAPRARPKPGARQRIGSLLLAGLAAQQLSAQTTGRIDGRASGPGGQPLTGVGITVTSASLPGAQHATTDDRGLFRLLTLPPGEYRVVAELAGFHTVEQTDVRVPLDGSVVLDIGLVPVFEENITVPGRAPILDATSATRGIELTREVFEVLPAARSTGMVVNPGTEGAITLGVLAPGVVPAPLGAPRIAGSGINESRYLVDGVDTTDPNRGMPGIGIPFEFVDEIEIKTGGYGAEYGGALAGVINVVTRSGGNQHRGGAFGYYRDQERQAGEFGDSRGFLEYDYGFDAGGRVVRDRLWYFIAVNPQSVTTDVISLQGSSLTETLHAARFNGKLTWQASASQRLNLSAMGKRHDLDFYNPVAVGLQGHEGQRFGRTFALTWDGSFGSNFIVEAAAGRFVVEESLHTLDDSAPAFLDLTPGGDLGHAAGLRRHFRSTSSGGDLVHTRMPGR